MSGSLDEQIIQLLPDAAALYYRLIVVVAPPDSGKTRALREVAAQAGGLYINVGLELSRRLVALTERDRARSVQRLLDAIVGRTAALVLLDHLEVLFDVSLKIDPLVMLQRLSRQRTIVAAWSGRVEEQHLIYAVPDHPEYRRYPCKDLLILTA